MFRQKQNLQNRNNFRITNIVFKKSKQNNQNQSLRISPLGTHLSQTIKTESQKSTKRGSNIGQMQVTSKFIESPQNNQKSYTNFMKGYIERLKRQRKRKNKRTSLSHYNRGKQQFFYTHKPPNVLILQKIKPKSKIQLSDGQKIKNLISQIEKSHKSGCSFTKQTLNQVLEGAEQSITIKNEVKWKKLNPLNTSQPKRKNSVFQPWKNDTEQHQLQISKIYG